MMRSALLVTHTGRRQSAQHARAVARDLLAAGFEVRVVAEEVADLDPPAPVTPVTGPSAAQGVEIVLALGGDGTFLRAVPGPDVEWESHFTTLTVVVSGG